MYLLCTKPLLMSVALNTPHPVECYFCCFISRRVVAAKWP